MDNFVFLARTPPPSLASHVDSLWYARGRSHHVDVIFPTAQVSMLVNLADPQRIAPDGQPEGIEREAWVIGQQRRVLRNTPTGETHVVGVTFKPHGAAAILGVRCRELTDRVVNLEGLWGSMARETRSRIADASTPDHKIHVLASILQGRTESEPRMVRVHHALQALTATKPMPVAEVCRRVALSNKSLVAEFNHFVGLGPKEVTRQSRLTRVLGDLASGLETPLAIVALRHGYYDQAHLNREFRRVSGMSPRDYLNRRKGYEGQSSNQTPQFVTG